VRPSHEPDYHDGPPGPSTGSCTPGLPVALWLRLTGGSDGAARARRGPGRGPFTPQADAKPER
jgi:hypothetical protein